MILSYGKWSDDSWPKPAVLTHLKRADLSQVGLRKRHVETPRRSRALETISLPPVQPMHGDLRGAMQVGGGERQEGGKLKGQQNDVDSQASEYQHFSFVQALAPERILTALSAASATHRLHAVLKNVLLSMESQSVVEDSDRHEARRDASDR